MFHSVPIYDSMRSGPYTTCVQPPITLHILPNLPIRYSCTNTARVGLLWEPPGQQGRSEPSGWVVIPAHFVIYTQVSMKVQTLPGIAVLGKTQQERGMDPPGDSICSKFFRKSPKRSSHSSQAAGWLGQDCGPRGHKKGFLPNRLIYAGNRCF